MSVYLEWNDFPVASAAFPNLWGKAGSPGYVQDSTHYGPDPGPLLGVSGIFLREITPLERAAELEEFVSHECKAQKTAPRVWDL